MKTGLFAKTENILGECPVWHEQRQSLFWLDIMNSVLFEKSWTGKGSSPDDNWKLPEMTSAMAVDAVDSDILWMITDRSFGSFSLSSGKYTPVLDLGIKANMRANDGGVSPDGSFWFGTMEKQPSGLNGAIYSISPGGVLCEHLSGIGIPNTFCWSIDGQTLYLSDSFRQQLSTYRYNGVTVDKGSVEVFLDLSGTRATPDGGAVSGNGRIWVSQWDGASVVCYSSDGDKIDTLEMDVPRPTSCCFGGPDYRHLFITSAREGLNQSELSRWPLSGAVFVSELQEKGLPAKPFSMK